MVQPYMPGGRLVDNGFRKVAMRAMDCPDQLLRVRRVRAAVNVYRNAGWPSCPSVLEDLLEQQFKNAKTMPLQPRPLADWGRLWRQVAYDQAGDKRTSFWKWNTFKVSQIVAIFVLEGGSAAQLREHLAIHIANIDCEADHGDMNPIDYLIAAEHTVWARMLMEGIDREGEAFVAPLRGTPALPGGIMQVEEVD